MLKENDIVQDRGRGPYMTVIEVLGDYAVCAWYVGSVLKDNMFNIKNLVLV